MVMLRNLRAYPRVVQIALPVVLAGIALLQATAVRAQVEAPPDANTPIKHFIVLMQENHSFDNYFGTPRAC